MKKTLLYSTHNVYGTHVLYLAAEEYWIKSNNAGCMVMGSLHEDRANISISESFLCDSNPLLEKKNMVIEVRGRYSVYCH